MISDHAAARAAGGPPRPAIMIARRFFFSSATVVAMAGAAQLLDCAAPSRVPVVVLLDPADSRPVSAIRPIAKAFVAVEKYCTGLMLVSTALRPLSRSTIPAPVRNRSPLGSHAPSRRFMLIRRR